MKLQEFDRKKVELIEIGGNIYRGKVYYCDKEDYDAEEDGLEMRVDENIWVFYESDIKAIEILN